MNARILIVEDELPMRIALQDCLESEGYRVITAQDGTAGLERACKEKPALMLVDVMMPNLDGFALCRELRQRGETCPLLMLTAKGQVKDRVQGLDSGADDYLVKPFSSEELLARVRALLRRIERTKKCGQVLRMGGIEVDLRHREARNGAAKIYLSAREFGMLQLLADAEGAPVSRQTFLDVVWGYAAFPTTRTVDTHIATLRAKLEDHPENPVWIKTAHGMGYRLEANAVFTKP